MPNRSTRTKPTSLLLRFAVLALLTGCGTTERRVLLVRTAWVDDRPVMAMRLSEPIRQRVLFKNGEEWELSKNEVDIDAGYYVVYPPPEKEK